MYVIILYYIGLINLIGFWSMYEDKKRAVNKQYRLSERTLFIIALSGGSVGSILGMYTFRHKTKHWYFKFGFPLILILQLILLSSTTPYTPQLLQLLGTVLKNSG